MNLNPTFELSMTLDTDHFQRLFTAKVSYLKELDDEYLDTSLAANGITIVYRDSRYKKRVRMLVNAGMVADDPSDTDKLLRKLDKRIAGYFNHEYTMDDFTLSGVTLIVDINVVNREKVSDYLKVIKRVGKIKGFSPIIPDPREKVSPPCSKGYELPGRGESHGCVYQNQSFSCDHQQKTRC